MKKLLLLFAAILMASTGMWAETVDYLYPVYNTADDPTSGIKEWKTASVDATVVENASEPVTWTAGWYVVKGSDVTLSQGAICSGNVHLILADGAKLTATGENLYASIQVLGTGNSLTIYGQTNQSGQLIANGGYTAAGIGGNNIADLRDGSYITINGGTVKANGGFQAAGIGGGFRGSGSNITINGGTVRAETGSDAAGIGGGCYGNGTNITINGGTVTSYGGEMAAGIGGGDHGIGSDITINDGTVTANGGVRAAGIGGGIEGSGSNITVNGGTVTANGVVNGAGIGGGSDGNGNGITITGGTVTANGGKNAAGIGGGGTCSGSNITITGGTVTANGGLCAAGIGGGIEGSGFNITINGGTVTATGGEYNGQYGEGIGSGFNGSASSGIYVRNNQLLVRIGDTEDTMYLIANNTGSDFAESLAGKRYVTIEPEPAPEEKEVTYIDGNGEEQKVKANVVLSRSFPVTWGEAGKTTWYVVTHADVQLISPVCQGDIRLILTDGAKLTATGADNEAGIRVSDEGNSLTIYGQAAQSGQLIATGGKYSAGIGGGNWGSGSNITINGGTVTANGGQDAAGIGSGNRGNGFNITINGGTVTANGGRNGAGIGGGNVGSGSNITINGGTVTANGGSNGAGIGGGHGGSGSNIAINGGTVTATGGFGSAGIGGGFEGSGFNITINGGTVTANGGQDAAGIGSGYGGSGYNIFVANILTLKAGSTENPTDVIANNGDDLAESLEGKRYVTIEPEPAPEEKEVTYIDENGEEQTVTTIVVSSHNLSVTLGEAGKTTWYVVTGDVILSAGAVCEGDVNLILADGAKLTATGTTDETNDIYTPGIQVTDGYTFTTYGQTAQSGQLIAIGGEWAAGIGGGNEGSGSNITINGGTVTANGGTMAAGIGGGNDGYGSSITINGGTVTANGGDYAAGIGGGNSADGSNITINGGIVIANGDTGAGIGGGCFGNGTNITINGGTVTANGGRMAAGIGGGNRGTASYITINGGTITATGGENVLFKRMCSGIGKGDDGDFPLYIFVDPSLVVKAGTNYELATVVENDGGDIAGYLSANNQKYVTITPSINLNITANQDPNHKQNYYATFYSSAADYQVPEYVIAYTGAVDGSVLKLTAIENGIIPAGEAVILRLTTENNTATKQQITLSLTSETVTKSNTNVLTGTNAKMTLGANDYALSLGQNGVGFYLWNGKEIGANKAYLTLNASFGAKAFTFQFDNGETTAIEQPAINGKQSGDTYNLNGVRVNDNYKGIVIKNGKKVLKK